MSDGDSGKRLNCLICGIELSTNTSYSIFCTVVPHSGTLLATSVQKVINKHVDKSSLPSSHVCNMCFSLLEDLDLAEEKCNTLRKNILNTFLKHCQTNGFHLDGVPGIACQTEDKLDSETAEPEVVKAKDKGSVESNEDDDEDNGDNGDNEPEEVIPEKQESTEKVTRSKKNSSAPAPEPKSSSKPARNKRKGRPAKKASSGKRSSSPASAAVSSADTSTSSSSTSTTTTATITQTSNGKYVIRTKDARRRRRYVHPCALCGRLFRRPCEVKQHLLSHGGAKPYQCRDCGKRFGSKSGAGIHALKQHGKDVTVEDIIEVCHDALTGVDVNLTPENIKEIIKQNMKESGLGDDHSESNGSTDNDDDDFEWKLEDEDELFKTTEDNGEKKDDDVDDPLRIDSEPTENPPATEPAASTIEVEVKEEGEEILSTMEVKKEDEDKMKTMESLKLKLVLNKPGRSKGGGGGGAAGGGTSGGESTAAKEKPKRKKKKDPLPKPPKHECPLCGKMWRTMSEFKSHVNTHSDERPFICEICGQAYKHKAALDIHVGMHNGINPFCCPYCNKAFTQKGALQRHLPIHTGEAPFQCELCGKRFVHHTSFNMHTLAHTGQKSYKCKVCGLALLSGSHLKRHSRVHTGERPYQCQTCGKRFAERYNLVAHTRVHDPAGSAAKDGSKKVHRCQLCGAGFDRKPKLEDHLALSHNKISDSDDSRKWVGHLITTNEVNQHGMPANVPGAPMVQMHQASPVSMVAIPGPEAMGRRDVDLKPTAALASVQMHQALGMGPPPAAAEHHPHQQSWHHMLFGGTSGKMEENMDGTGGAGMGPGPHIDTKMGPLSQHRLLSEMSALGGIGHNMGRNMLQSCLVGAAAAAGHPSLGHPHHIPNPHAGIGPSRINMFGGENNNH